ncbi:MULTISPECIES: DUF2789 domain-containing protein [Ferrimonas]|uniref:DUF2789 domain-containing protein n=1 Tax=Ferrimonas TaxID=44011 RepID=UPI0003FEF720|nr:MULTISPECIES: DUF2789 domain-containing protein [Ferrimonas]USD36788.1 DUF2789 domain-containing protein [Ferrimonas sp. SCSIO 43195]
MDTTQATLPHLFEQLGLPSSEQAINQFIQAHPLDRATPLEQAPFWTAAQSSFLSEERNRDAQWSEVIDTLDTLLHK